MKSIKPIYNNNTLNKNTNTSFSVVDNFFGKQMLDWIISWQISLVLYRLFFWCISLEFQNQICGWAGIQSELSDQIICELVKKALLASSSYISILNSIFSNCGQLVIFSKSFQGYFQNLFLDIFKKHCWHSRVLRLKIQQLHQGTRYFSQKNIRIMSISRALINQI